MNEDDLKDFPCPNCEAVGQLHIEYRREFVASRDFSLAGSTLKISGRFVQWPWLVCGACGIESRGKRG